MRLILFAAAMVLSACTGPAAPAVDPAPEGPVRIFTGGTIYTGLENPATVEAVIVSADGRILGTAPPLSQDWSEEEAEIIDLAGAVMFSGFTDAHAHLLGIGQREMTLNLEGTASIDELVTRTEIELQDKPAGAVLDGRGWIETGWPEGRMPSAADLDAVSAALAAAGITDETPDPAGGKIERDANGKATGILIDNAMTPMAALVAQPDELAIAEAYETGDGQFVRLGDQGRASMPAAAGRACTI